MILVSTSRKLVVLFIGVLLSNLSHASFTQVISFGDSLSDTGNLFQAASGHALIADAALPHANYLCPFHSQLHCL
jgi:phospholipase/lecithinase/hemolysin